MCSLRAVQVNSPLCFLGRAAGGRCFVKLTVNDILAVLSGQPHCRGFLELQTHARVGTCLRDFKHLHELRCDVGKSLCYQLPALISSKVVVVISPLINPMHDQCMQLAAAGVSACFLGSGQPDHGVELRALYGSFSVVYMCPESLPR